MGGGSGGGLPSSDLRRLEESAKKKLQEATDKGSPHVFISFCHEDLDEINLLRGQAKNEKLDLEFDDYSVKEPFNSVNADYIRGKIREKIDHVSVTVVYLTKNSASSDWVNWEISESIKRGKGVVGVYKKDSPPRNLPKAFSENGCKAVPWSHGELVKAIEDAGRNR
jgi:hypothetical protein